MPPRPRRRDVVVALLVCAFFGSGAVSASGVDVASCAEGASAERLAFAPVASGLGGPSGLARSSVISREQAVRFLESRGLDPKRVRSFVSSFDEGPSRRGSSKRARSSSDSRESRRIGEVS